MLSIRSTHAWPNDRSFGGCSDPHHLAPDASVCKLAAGLELVGASAHAGAAVIEGVSSEE